VQAKIRAIRAYSFGYSTLNLGRGRSDDRKAEEGLN
jgi:hypothetical protein